MSAAASDRYITADFQNNPLLALADLLGLKHYQGPISAKPELYAPILNGIAVYRHLSAHQRRQVNSAIFRDIPRDNLAFKLLGMTADLAVQKYWFMWSLSDEELQEFYHFAKIKAGVTDQMNPLSLPDISVGTLAAGLF
jgi:hypothetical protein